MSLADVTARIAAIQARIAPLRAAPALSGTDAVGGDPAFAAALAALQVPSGTDPTGTTADVTTPPDATAAPDGDDLAAWAARYAGTPYVAGGRDPRSGWDCAGFTQWVARQFGIDLPPVSWQQIRSGSPVADLQHAAPGDLLFFHEPGGHRRDPSPLKVNHVGIYLGDGRMVEAASPSRGTRISRVDTAHLVGIRRIAPSGDGVARTPEEVQAASSARAVLGTSRPGGPALSARALVSVLQQAGFTGDGLRTAWAVAMRESGGRPGAVGAVNPDGTRDHGLFQLNDVHLGRDVDPAQVYDAAANAAAAFRMSDGGTNWAAWGLGDTGWAAHLRQAAPDTYARLGAAFRAWYDRYPPTG